MPLRKWIVLLLFFHIRHTFLSKCLLRMQKRRKSNLIRIFLWRTKVSEALCKRDCQNVRSSLFFNVWKFRTKISNSVYKDLNCCTRSQQASKLLIFIPKWACLSAERLRFSITAKHFQLHSCSIALIVSRPSSFYPTVQSVNLSGLHWVPWSWRSGYMRVSQACVGKAGPCFPKALTIQQSGFSGQRLLRDSQHCSQSDGVQSRPEQQTPRMKCIQGEMIELLYFLSSLFLQDVLDFCRYVYMSRPRWSSLDLNMSIKHEHRKQNK